MAVTEQACEHKMCVRCAGNGIPAKVMYSVIVPGNPQPPVFYSNSTDVYPDALQVRV